MAEAEGDTPADFKVDVNQKGGMSKWQAIGVVGIGTFLLTAIVPWMMYLIGTVIPKNTEAITTMTEQSKDVESAIRSNTRALNRINEKIGPDPDSE
jgi:hypothetical protein